MPKILKFEPRLLRDKQALASAQLETEKARLLGLGHTEEEVDKIFKLSRERKRILFEIKELEQAKGAEATDQIEELKKELDEVIKERKKLQRTMFKRTKPEEFEKKGAEDTEKILIPLGYEKISWEEIRTGKSYVQARRDLFEAKDDLLDTSGTRRLFTAGNLYLIMDLNKTLKEKLVKNIRIIDDGHKGLYPIKAAKFQYFIPLKKEKE